MSDEYIEIKDLGFKKLMKAFGTTLPTIKIGVLGNDKRTSAGQPAGEKPAPTNAEIGAAHEYGTSKLPVRSFLRMPLNLKLNEYLEGSGAFDETTLRKVIKEGTIGPWMKKVAILGEQVVQDAFASNGFGQWKPSDMTHKENHQTLVETQQLRNSITSKVDDK